MSFFMPNSQSQYSVFIAKATRKPICLNEDQSFSLAMENATELYQSSKILNNHQLALSGIACFIVPQHLQETWKNHAMGVPPFNAQEVYQIGAY